ncbi:MAG: amino acid ABC transporter substrate-binding protein [bacterium]
MKRIRGFRLLLGVMLSVFLVLGGFAGAGDAGAAGEIKIGAALPLTGPLATEGKKQQAGYEIWRERVNAAGGVNVGGKKMKVKIIYMDYESKTPTATKIAERLITKEKVVLLLGPFGSGATKSVAAITERYQVPLIAPVASSEAIFDQGYKYLFGLLAPNSFLPNNFFELIKAQKPRPKTMAFVTRNDFFPRAITNMVRKHAKKHGIEDVYYATFPKDSKDMSTWLTVVKSKNPDILMVGGYLPDTLLAAKQAAELGVNPKIFFTMVGPVYAQFTEALGKTANNILTAAWWGEALSYKGDFIGTPRDFGKIWRKKFNQEPDYVAAASTAAGIVAQMAIEKAGSLDRKKIRGAIANMDAQTFFGPVKFDKRGQNTASAIVFFQVQDGKRKTVAPSDIANSKLIYPK